MLAHGPAHIKEQSPAAGAAGLGFSLNKSVLDFYRLAYSTNESQTTTYPDPGTEK